MLGIVGESGSGKSVVDAGRDGPDRPARPRHARTCCASPAPSCCASPPRQRRRLVGSDMAMIFQEPMSSLNPCYPVGWQIAEALRAHDAVPTPRRCARAWWSCSTRSAFRRPASGWAPFRTSSPAG